MMLVEVTIDELQALWALPHFREAEQSGFLIVRENAATLLVEVRNREGFLQLIPGALDSETEKQFVRAVQRGV